MNVLLTEPNTNLSINKPASRPPICNVCVRLPAGTVKVAGVELPLPL